MLWSKSIEVANLSLVNVMKMVDLSVGMGMNTALKVIRVTVWK